MKVTYTPSGGRFGYGFDYYCAECDIFVGNSLDDQLKHPATQKQGKLFRRIEVPIACSQSGKVCELPKHEIEAPAV